MVEKTGELLVWVWTKMTDTVMDFGDFSFSLADVFAVCIAVYCVSQVIGAIGLGEE